jgi:hypothetical protein
MIKRTLCRHWGRKGGKGGRGGEEQARARVREGWQGSEREGEREDSVVGNSRKEWVVT